MKLHSYTMLYPPPPPLAGWFTSSLAVAQSLVGTLSAAHSAASASSASLCHAKLPAKLAFVPFRPLPLGPQMRFPNFTLFVEAFSVEVGALSMMVLRVEDLAVSAPLDFGQAN